MERRRGEGVTEVSHHAMLSVSSSSSADSLPDDSCSVLCHDARQAELGLGQVWNW